METKNGVIFSRPTARGRPGKNYPVIIIPLPSVAAEISRLLGAHLDGNGLLARFFKFQGQGGLGASR